MLINFGQPARTYVGCGLGRVKRALAFRSWTVRACSAASGYANTGVQLSYANTGVQQDPLVRRVYAWCFKAKRTPQAPPIAREGIISRLSHFSDPTKSINRALITHPHTLGSHVTKPWLPLS